MNSLFGRSVFLVGDEAFFWEDVLLASLRWGAWGALEREARDGLVRMRSLRAAGRTLAGAEVERAAADFRYAHDLIAADDTVAWLDRWGLTASEWMDFIRCRVLCGTPGEPPPNTRADHELPPPAAEVAAVLPTMLVCSGALTRLARRLAERAAARAYLASTPADGDAGPADGARAPPRLPAESGDVAELVFAGLDSDRTRERATVVASFDGVVQRLRERVLTPQAVRNVIVSNELDWTRVGYRALHFPDEAMAREAVLCLRDDGLGVGAVAAAAGVAVLEARCWLDEVTGALRDRMLAARPGDVVGPLRVNGSFALYHVDAKWRPHLDDDEVRRRAEDRAVERALAQEMNERVRWEMLP
jgi:hypothetical protein